MTKSNKFFSTMSALALLGSASLIGCGSRDGESLMTISGALSLATQNVAALSAGDTVGYTPNAITDTWKVRCVTLTGTPQAGEGSVTPSTGAFSLELLVAESAAIGCLILDGLSIVAVASFVSAETSLTGDTTRSGSFVAKSGASALEFGTISVNTSTGLATVQVANIVQTGGEDVADSWTDPTGVWQYQMFCDENLAATTAEYTACTTMLANEPQHTSGTLYLKQYAATDSSGATQYGLSLWESQAALTACGGEGVTLPAGWAVVSGSEGLTTATTLAGLPAQSAVQNQNQTCGNSSSTCDQVTNTANWGKPGGGSYSNAECKAMCVANGWWTYRESVDQSTTCIPRVEGNNWAYTGAMTYTQGAAFIGASSSNYLMKLGDEPEARIVMDKAVIGGSTASVSAVRTRTETACVNHGPSGCTSVSCPIVETENITFVQTSSTEMKAEVKSKTKLESSASANCLAADSHLSYWLGDDGEDARAFSVNMTKQ